MQDKQKSCEERIDAELEHELEQIQEALKVEVERYLLTCECGQEWESDDELEDCPECGGDDVSVEALDPDEEGTYDLLCPPYIKHVVVRAERSYGGPQDYWDLYLDPEDGEIVRIFYHFLDWWDGAQRELQDEQFKLVAEMFQEEMRYLVGERLVGAHHSTV